MAAIGQLVSLTTPKRENNATMVRVTKTATANAPIDAVWKKLSALTAIEDWSESTISAHYHTEAREGARASRAVKVKRLGTMRETATEWNDGERFKMAIEGIPSFVKRSTGQSSLKSLGPETTRVTSTVTIETGWGIVGTVIEKLAMGPQLNTTVGTILAGFVVYAEQ